MSLAFNAWLAGAAALSALAALLHLGCIAFGPAWYRAFGAGERLARPAERGSPVPTLATLAIASVLALWAAYAASGAGLLPRLPWLRGVLCVIAAIYLLRGLAGLPMMLSMPGRSTAFWLWSSATCIGIGLVHVAGLRQGWSQL